MSGRYLLRFDDLCPTLNWSAWDKIEDILADTAVQPIVAVVPENRDPKLLVSQAQPGFWERVRRWQALGWTVGMHGVHHIAQTNDRGLLNRNARSEFAGVPETEQRMMLERAVSIFAREGVEVRTWIAPFHSFDATTLRLLLEFGIDTISDGSGLFPYSDADGRFWVPQQLWRFSKIPFGVATICMHINRWSDFDVARLESNIKRFRPQLIDVESLRGRYSGRRRRPSDRFVQRAVLATARVVDRT